MATISTANPTTLPANPSANLSVVLQWIRAATALDLDTIEALLSDSDFEHELVPEFFIKASGFASVRKGKEEFREGFSKVFALIKNPAPVIHEVIESENKVVIHARGAGTSITGHPYTNEWIFIFTLQPSTDGGEPKILRIKEFLDSLYMSQFFAAEVERVKKAKEGSQA